jgi:hypothetical protein
MSNLANRNNKLAALLLAVFAIIFVLSIVLGYISTSAR